MLTFDALEVGPGAEDDMNMDGFWSLIDECRGETDGCEALADSVVRRLSTLPRAEVAAFIRLFDETLDRAYRWDLWGAAYIINGGCSDDGFEYFRCWLIAQGRDTFERALAGPESLADVAEADVECEDLLYAGTRAWEAVAGESQRPERYAPFPPEPTGRPWTEEELDARFPRLTAAFGE